MSGLAAKKCTPCEGGIDPLSREQAQALLLQVPGWEMSENDNAIRRALNEKYTTELEVEPDGSGGILFTILDNGEEQVHYYFKSGKIIVMPVK